MYPVQGRQDVDIAVLSEVGPNGRSKEGKFPHGVGSAEIAYCFFGDGDLGIHGADEFTNENGRSVRIILLYAAARCNTRMRGDTFERNSAVAMRMSYSA